MKVQSKDLAAELREKKNHLKKVKREEGRFASEFVLFKHIISQVQAAKWLFSAATTQQPKPFQSYAT